MILPLCRLRLYRLVLVLAVWLMLSASGGSVLAQAIITLETTPYPINLAAENIRTWQKEGVRVFVADENVWITQGKLLITADSAALLFYEQEALQQKEARVDLYCEKKVTLIQDKDVQNFEQLFVRLETASGIVVNPHSGRVVTFEEEQPMDVYLKAIKIRDQRKGEFASREPLVQVTKEPGVVDIVADDIDSWVEGNQRIVSALGNVVLHRGETTMEADNALLWFEEEEVDGKKKHIFKELYAEGNVTLRSKEDIRKADKIFQNIPEKKGIYINPRIKTIKPEPPQMPIYMGGKEAKQIDQDHMVIKDGYFTTCSFGHPHYRFNSRYVTVTQRRTPTESYSEIVARHDTFLIGDIPVAYLPKYAYDTRTKPSVFKGIGWGNSDRLGTFVHSTWDPLALTLFSGLNRWMSTVVKLDYLSMRGPAGGLDLDYKRANMLGTFETYFVKDRAERDQTGNMLIEHENRGRVLWRHRQNLSKYWRADAEFSFISDRNFLREYFEREFKEGKEQETDLYLRRLEDNKALTFLAKKQIHRFDTGLEALPQLSYQLISQPLWEDRLNFTSQSELGYLDFHLDDELDVRNPSRFNRLQRTTGNSLRLDSNNIISSPFQLWIWKLKPFVGGRLTAYSKSLEDRGPNDGPPVGRFAASLGLDASTSFWRVYSLESKLFRIHKLKHIISPEFRWEAGPIVTENPNDLLQYVPADGLDKYNSLIFGIRNRLQTRRGAPLQTVDLMDVDLELHFLPSPEKTEGFVTHQVGNAEGFLIPKKDSFLQPEFRSQLTDRIALVSERNEFNLDELTFDVYNGGINFQNSPRWSQFIGYRFLKDISSSVILETHLLLREKWGLTFEETYALRSKDFTGNTSTQNLSTRLSLSRRAHDWTGMFTLNFDAANENTTFRFDVLPVGVKKPVGRRYSFTGQ